MVTIEMHTEYAERSQLGGQLAHRQATVGEPFCDVWTQSGLAESTHRVTDAPFLVVQEAVKAQTGPAVSPPKLRSIVPPST